MTQVKNHSGQELPSTGKLVKSTILATFLAAVLLVTVVLPAEYGIDPTGFGRLTGLKRMGEIKTSLAQEVDNQAAAIDSDKAAIVLETEQPLDLVTQEVTDSLESATRVDTFTVYLSPNEGKEIKLTLAKGEQVQYSWWTDGGKANFDAHADSKELEIKYHNYDKGAEGRSEGVLEAAFDGNHGWFWRNRTSENMTVTLRVEGMYSNIIQPN